jgi:hypothetical protein
LQNLRQDCKEQYLPNTVFITYVVLSKSFDCVIHAHSPEIWLATSTLKLPHTSKGIPYGTPEMATAIAQLMNTSSSGLFTMLGHEDGVISYGKDFASAFALLTKALLDAKQI